MRIGIDARLYSQSGIGRYIRNLLSELQEIDHSNEYFIFLLEKNFDLNFKKNFVKVRADFGWYGLNEQVKFPILLNKYKLDLMHFPHFNVPIFYNASWSFVHRGKFIVTIHDLIHQHFQMKRATLHDPIIYNLKKFGYKKVFSSAIRKSKKIITVSEFVKNQLIDEWKVIEDKIIVTKEAVEENLIKLAKNISKNEIENTLSKFGVNTPFIFYVGTAPPHKNVERLIGAFREVREKFEDLQLVLSGQDHFFWERIRNYYKDSSIIYTGFITDRELVAFYKSAKCFVMPSLEEGFGIPILEAFACGCPVISSSAGSLPEVGSDACMYFDPKNIDDMANKIIQVLNSKKLQSELIKKGQKRYKKFSWEKLAKETLKIYKGN